MLRNSSHIYNSIDNDNDTAVAGRYLFYAQNRYIRDPIDNYRIGNIYDFVLRDTKKAQDYYLHAIDQIRQTPSADAPFIINRLEDRININYAAEEDDHQLILDQLITLNDELRDLNLPQSDPGLRITWTSDSQNVHDSNINNEMRDDYERIKEFNRANGVYVWSAAEMIDFFTNVYNPAENERLNVPDAIKMIEYIVVKNGTISKLQTDEINFLCDVFSRIQYEQPQKAMIENLVLNLKESYGNGRPMCITGRTARILSSFAGFDEIGIFKSKPVLKNEIFAKAGAVRNRIYEAAGEELRKKYDEGVDDPDTTSLIKNMHDDVTTMVLTDYKDLYAADTAFVNKILEEIYGTL
jgi:hypothetical protein